MDPALWIAGGTVAALIGFLWFVRQIDPDRRIRTLRSPAESLLLRQRRLSAAALVALTLGTFVWRIRTSQSLEDAPVDAAASVRIVADASALVLVWLAQLTARRRDASKSSARSLTLVFYGLYVAAVVASAIAAIVPQLVLFRAAELAVALLVAWSVAACRDVDQLVTLARRVLLSLTALIAVSAVLAPELALKRSFGGIAPFRLEGVYPAMSSNTVGFIGMLLFAIGLGSRSRRWIPMAAGVALVALSQYRTGYVALGVIFVLYLIANRNISRKMLVVLAVPAIVYVVRSPYFLTAWQRGEIAQRSAETLSGRIAWWEAGLQVVQRSPYVGTGLTSGTRYEVMSRLGNTTTNSIHSTWLEVYVGTGMLGLAAFGLVLVRAVWLTWIGRAFSLVPLLFLAAVLVRSATGSTIELAGWPVALMVMLLLGVERARQDREPDRVEAPPAMTLWRS